MLCNGVVLPDNEALNSIEQILKTRQLTAKAWIDEGVGEDEGMQYLYDMRLNFGDKAVDNLKTGDRLDRCLPDREFDSRITVDKKKQDDCCSIGMECVSREHTTKRFAQWWRDIKV